MSTLKWIAGIIAMLTVSVQAAPRPESFSNSNSRCRKTQVAILGAGTAGITAAQALSNASVTDFVIIEYNDRIGGRVLNRPFGNRPDGNGKYFVELGANW